MIFFVLKLVWEYIYIGISVGIYILELVGGECPRESNGDEHDGNPFKKIVQQYICPPRTRDAPPASQS